MKFLITGLLALTLVSCTIQDYELIDVIEQCNEHENLRSVWIDFETIRAQCHDGTEVAYKGE